MAGNDPLPVKVDPAVATSIVEKEYARRPERPPGPVRKVAIIVNHGMGQQVPFETLELVARALWKKEHEKKEKNESLVQNEEIVTRMARLGIEGKPEEEEFARAEVRLTGVDPTGNPTEVEAHLYEAYWAPLTEGKVGMGQVIWFLFDAGWNGIRNSFSGSFRRWMFGAWQSRPFRAPQLIFSFLAAILLVLSLIIINVTIVTAAASHAIGGSGSWPPASLVGLLTRDVFLVDLCALSIFFGTIALPSGAHKFSSPGTRWLYLAWFFTLAGIGGVMFLGLLIGAHIAIWPARPWAVLTTSRHVGPAFRRLLILSPVRTLLSWRWIRFLFELFWPHRMVGGWFNRRWIELVLWSAAVVASYRARTVIVEYVGDVTAYIAAHTVSIFWEVRKAIYDLALSVARAVYRAKSDDLCDFAYQDIIVVGHSLGSVIAYDVLNGLLIEEGFSRDPATISKDPEIKKPLNVAGRTSLFLTFGSPLDKTAFIFRTQAAVNSALREAEAAAVQPMIQDYRFRPRRWINIWSYSDWISGSLEYYDDWMRGTGAERRVWNVRDTDAKAPLVAHTQYWQNDVFADILYDATTGRRPAPDAQRQTFLQKHFPFSFFYGTPGDQLR